jgi:SMC interacting uncharacterized protein involved in chromosome segregation
MAKKQPEIILEEDQNPLLAAVQSPPVELAPVDETTGDNADDVHFIAGAITGMTFTSRLNDVLAVRAMKKLKDSKTYKTQYRTWENFCNLRLGCDVKTVNARIKELESYGETAYSSLVSFGMSSKDLKLLRSGETETKVLTSGKVTEIVIGDESVELTEENRPTITHLLELESRKLTEANKEAKEQKKKAKDLQKEIIASKEKYFALTDNEKAFEKKVNEIQHNFILALKGIEKLKQIAATSPNDLIPGIYNGLIENIETLYPTVAENFHL